MGTINSILPLTNLGKLTIVNCALSFGLLLNLLRYTPNLHTLKFGNNLSFTQESHSESRILSDSDKGQTVNIPNIHGFQ